ncbi:MAG TPA: glutathione S-transferase family protein [Aliiroseovarius sp.]|nr:glutathione S-transferase family protein [Aliiroseovarius sp.]
MLILRALPGGDGLASQSPFVLKTMGWLTVLGLDWQADYKADIRKQPNGKLPVLVDGDRVIPDSEAIAEYLQDKAGRRLDDGLGARDQALSQALIRMVEEHSYFIGVWNRWSEDDNFAPVRAAIEKAAPFPLSRLLPGIIRKGVLKQVRAQGIGRMDDDLRLARFTADLDAVEAVLGPGPWLFGDQPRAADLSVGAILAAIVVTPKDTEIRRAITSRPALTAYVARARAELFPAPDAIARVPA